jgi:hypothetical protein
MYHFSLLVFHHWGEGGGEGGERGGRGGGRREGGARHMCFISTLMLLPNVVTTVLLNKFVAIVVVCVKVVCLFVVLGSIVADIIVVVVIVIVSRVVLLMSLSWLGYRTSPKKRRTSSLERLPDPDIKILPGRDRLR